MVVHATAVHAFVRGLDVADLEEGEVRAVLGRVRGRGDEEEAAAISAAYAVAPVQGKVGVAPVVAWGRMDTVRAAVMLCCLLYTLTICLSHYLPIC